METIISFVLRAGWRNPALVFCHPNSIFSKFYLFFSLCTSEPSIRQTAFPPGNGVLTQTKMTFLWSGPLPLKDQKIQDHFRQCLPQEKQKMLGFTYQLQMSLMVPFKVDERLAKKKGGCTVSPSANQVTSTQDKVSEGGLRPSSHSSPQILTVVTHPLSVLTNYFLPQNQ